MHGREMAETWDKLGYTWKSSGQLRGRLWRQMPGAQPWLCHSLCDLR